MSTLQVVDLNKQASGTLGSLSTKAVFLKEGDPAFYMKVKPVSYLLNSTLVQDKLNAGFCMVVSLSSGTMYFMKGTEVVQPVKEAQLHVQA